MLIGQLWHQVICPAVEDVVEAAHLARDHVIDAIDQRVDVDALPQLEAALSARETQASP
jgi:hypothetical protein